MATAPWDKPTGELAPWERPKIAAPITPGATMQPAAPAPSGIASTLEDAEKDLRTGGGRTMLGRGIGYMQGRGNKGMSGLESGASPAQADFMGSVPLGLTRAAEGIAEHKPLKTISGGLQAASLPLSFAAGPEIETALGAIPSKLHAGQVIGGVEQAAKGLPVNLANTLPPLERAQQLSTAGHGTVGALDSLYNRMNTVNPLDFGEARDRASALGRLTGEDLIKASKPLLSQAKQVGHGLKADIGATAAGIGQAEPYLAGLKEYQRASAISDAAEKARKYAIPAAATAVGGGALYKYGKGILGK